MAYNVVVDVKFKIPTLILDQKEAEQKVVEMLVKKIEEMGFVEDCNFAVVGIVSVSLPGHNAYV